MKLKHVLLDDKVIVVLLSILVFVICVARVPMRVGFGFFPDEPATFAIAAYFLGHDWSEVISRGGYYSYGYAILLLPIFIIFNDPDLIYTAALMLNALLASLLIPLAYGLTKRWGLVSIGSNLAYIPVLLFPALSGAVIAYSLLGLPEIALVVVAFAATLVLNKLQEEDCGYHWFAIQALLLTYGYVLHQRFLGVLIAGVLIMLLMAILRKIALKKALLFFLSIAVLYAVHTVIKNDIQENLWSTTPAPVVEQFLPAVEAETAETVEATEPVTTPAPPPAPLVNDYQQIFRHVIRIFTDINRFVSLIRVAIGQMFYLGVASFMLIFFAIHELAKKNIKFIRKVKEQKSSFDFTQMFMLIAFFLTYIISVLFMHSPGRSDGLVYGRYNTIMYLVLCLFILSKIVNKQYVLSKSTAVIAVVFIGMTILTDHNFRNFFNHLTYAPSMAVDLNFYREHFANRPFIFAGVIACLVGISIMAFYKIDKGLLAKSLVSVVLIGTLAISHISAYLTMNVFNHYFHVPIFEATDETTDSMAATDLPVYFLRTQTRRHDVISEEIFQYRLFDRPLRLVYHPNQIRHDSYYLVTTSLITFMSMFEDYNTSFVNDSGLFALFRVGSDVENRMHLGGDVRTLLMINEFDVRIDNPHFFAGGGFMWTGARSSYLLSFEANQDFLFRIRLQNPIPQEVGSLELNFSLNADDSIIYSTSVDSDTEIIEFVVPEDLLTGRHHILHMTGDTWSWSEIGRSQDTQRRGIQLLSVEARPSQAY